MRLLFASPIISAVVTLLAMITEGPPLHPKGRMLTVLVIVGCVSVALAIRILWPYDNVFVDGSVWFRGMDPWYHMRLVHNLIQNFPHLTEFDPLTNYPHGIIPPFHPLTGWLIALPALLLGKGSPSPQLIDTVGAVTPAVLGALTIIPAYFIGRALYGRIAGLVGALVLAVMPGEFLSRTMLGFSDHHASEAFFSALTLVFAMLATQSAASSGFTLRGMRKQLSTTYRRTGILVVIGGVCLGLYLLAWRGGLMVLLILFAYALVRTVIDYRRDRPSDDVVFVCTVMTAIGAIMVAPVVATNWTPDLLVLALLASGLGPIVLLYFSSLARRRMWSLRSFLLFLLGCVIAAGALVILLWPAAFNYAKDAAAFMLRGSAQNITEMHPLFTPFGTFSVRIAWTNFVGILPTSLFALFVLWRSRRSPRGNEVTLFLVWTLVMLAAVITQRRFGYYYSVNAAVLTGFITAWVWNSTWCTTQKSALQQKVPSIKKATAKSEKRAVLAQRTKKRGATAKLALLIILFFALIIAPCVQMARNFATERSLMTTGWYETMLWLKDNTPEPMSDNADMLLFDPPSAGSDFDYPPDAYSVMAWWDYGHWLTSVAKRIPVSNPFQDGARAAAGYLIAQDEADGAEALEALGSRYVMVDAKTSVASFPGVVWWASLQEDDFFELYYQRTADGTWESIVLYYPRYYESMLVRLYNFSAQGFSPDEFTVIRYDENRETTPPRKEIVGVEWFSTYDEALLYLEDADDEHFRLVSSDPLVSAIPLDVLQGYVSVYESPSRVPVGGHTMPQVKVFEYTG